MFIAQRMPQEMLNVPNALSPACRGLYESVPRTVPNCTEPHAVQKCSETAPHWSTSGTVRSTSFALLPPCDLRPPGNPPELPSPLPVSPIGDPGFEPVTAKPAVRTRKQLGFLRHVDKMHEIFAAQTGKLCQGIMTA